MSYNHGIVTGEQTTGLVSPVSSESALAVVFGTAPINMGNIENVNKPVLCHSYKEAVEQMGYLDDFTAGYTLPEVIYSQFMLYGVSPVIFVNVLDPKRHIADESALSADITDGKITLPHTGVLTGEAMTVSMDNTDLKKGEDYETSFLPDGRLVINIINKDIDTAINNKAAVSYKRLDPSLVTKSEIIGGIDANTSARTGIVLADEIYPRFRMAPAILAAPGFSQDNEVALALASKSGSINGLFKAVALADIQAEEITGCALVAGYKNKFNIISENLITAWPKVTLGGREYWMSTHLIGVMGKTDASYGCLPYKSPSNESMNIDGLVNNGAEVILTPDEAAALNGQGVITALNFIGGFKAWGNRTSVYPGVTDVKDCMIPVRRMFAWANNTIILTYWQKVDYPIRKRTIESISDSVTFWLNGLTAREIILGGRIVFDESENPVTDIMDGIIRFHLYLTPPTPAREIDFTLEYDPEYLETLFG